MSFETIQLPTLVIAELFKHSLVELDIKQSTTEVSNEGNYIILGNNKKQGHYKH